MGKRLIIIMIFLIICNVIKAEEIENINYFFHKIDILDRDNLLTENEEFYINNKYRYKNLGRENIENIVEEVNNKLKNKGYITTTVLVNNIENDILTLEIFSGNIEDIKINNGDMSDKINEFFMFPKNRGKVLNIKDLDIATDNFNYLQSNNMKMEIITEENSNLSKIIVSNEMKNKNTLSVNFNNHGETEQVGIWRYGINFNMDSPFGIGDYFKFTYLTVNERKVDRSWKIKENEIKPGEIMPIGPSNYNPKNGDKLPYRRRMDMFSFGYGLKFREYTLKLNSSKSIQENSIYAHNTIYDLKSSNHIVGLGIEKIVYMDSKNKMVLGFDITKKHNDNFLEKIKLLDRNLTVGKIELKSVTKFEKGLLEINLGYERGLKLFKAERDKNKIETTPKAQFNKHTLSVNYQRKITPKLTYRLEVNGMYSDNVLYSSERKNIGGIGSVGGFKTDRIDGDKGIEINKELLYKIELNNISVVPYINYGYGIVKRNKSINNKDYVSGITTGIKIKGNYIDMDLGYGKGLSHSKNLKPKKRDIYFSVGLKFNF